MSNYNLDHYFDKSNPFEDIFKQTNHQHYQNTKDEVTSLSVSVVGHNPKNVNVEVDNKQLRIKSDKPKYSPDFVEEIDLEFTLPSGLNPEPKSAEIKNGVLTIKFGKVEEKTKEKNKVTVKY